MKSYLKFFLKMCIVRPLREFFLFVWGPKTNRNGWDDRLLVINCEALGDVIAFTSVLKHYKKRFPGKKIYLLVKKGIGLEKLFKGTFADEVLSLDYRKFAVNPFYGASFIAMLRGIGFCKVINQDFSAAEIMGNIISVSVGAEEVVSYEGMGAEFSRPVDFQQAQDLRIVCEKVYPLCTKVIPSLDVLRGVARKLPSVIAQYVHIYEEATGQKESEYATEFPQAVFEDASETLKKFGLEAKKYAIVNVNASVAYKRWPLDRFAKVAAFLYGKGLTIVLVGSGGEAPLTKRFEEVAGVSCVNLAGRTSIPELIRMVANAAVVVTNDTSLVHFAVAAKTPSLAIVGGGQFGMFLDYGHLAINKWVYKESACYGDNWRCGNTVTPGEPAPCVAAVSVESVLEKLAALFSYAASNKNAPLGKFEEGWAPEERPKNENAAVKVIYAGSQKEMYHPGRGTSFEYNNFYLTLKSMPGVSVLEFPFEPIAGMGKKYWNRKLLETVRAEKPDILFTFMLSDEFDPATLEELKKITKTIAWYADDSWRFYNYSRRWYSHFTLNATTYSWIPALAAKLGVKNVVRSQWAANQSVWYPVDVKQKDIDVSFVGQYNPEREKVIKQLRNSGIDVFVRGWGWPEGKVSQAEALDIIARSKINLNINSQPSIWTFRSLARIIAKRSGVRLVPDFHLLQNLEAWRHIGVPQVKARPFELAACGAFTISGFADDLGNFYKENEEMVFYRSVGDLIAKIKEYLPKDADRERIANAGYERTVREHTYEKRFRDIFEKTGANTS
ncbi:MAG TPA: glycosyltransferase family 9 protein [Candidatus Paceibacterota bacterium]|nr:glycosyltransferase family 9 protein [Candidatus Paceibacterota bacterium]